MPEWIAQRSARLDILVAATLGCSRVKSGVLIRAGSVLLNGRVQRKPAHIVMEGDRIISSDTGEPATETHLPAIDLPIPVLYEDDACLVIAKPAGLAVHPAIGLKKDEPTILHGIAFLFQARHIPFAASSVLVHRLDRDTTGCLLVAKTPEAHRILQKQFKDRTVHKTYLALVAGIPTLATATIDAPVGRHHSDRTKMAVLGAIGGRSASTTYRVLDHTAIASLIACDLHTGRTHQIRVHLTAIGHSLLGDSAYHTQESDRINHQYSIDHICLHAWRLSFQSPADKATHAIQCDPPPSFCTSAKALGLQVPGAEKSLP